MGECFGKESNLSGGITYREGDRGDLQGGGFSVGLRLCCYSARAFGWDYFPRKKKGGVNKTGTTRLTRN